MKSTVEEAAPDTQQSVDSKAVHRSPAEINAAGRWSGRAGSLSASDLWVLACGAPLALHCDEPPASFSSPHTPTALRERYLGGSWGVWDKPSFRRYAHWLYHVGHTAEYSDILLDLMESEPAELRERIREADLELRRAYAFVDNTAHMTRSVGLLAWDSARFVTLARWGHATGYLSAAEAMSWAYRVARSCQQAFGSWREFNEHYLVGIAFADNSCRPPTIKSQTHARWLNINPMSPMRRLAWNTPLVPTPEIAALLEAPPRFVDEP